MLKLHVRHRTEMRYAGDAHDSINEVRLAPQTSGRQVVERAGIFVKPYVDVHRHIDAFGNEVAWFQIEDPHDRLLVEAEAIVAVTPHAPHPEAVPWRALDDAKLRCNLQEYLAGSRLVHWADAVESFAAELGCDHIDDVAAWLRAMERGVCDSIRYVPGSTSVDTTVRHVLEVRSGVCQDMAHLFLALCRRRGVPARYVSGWLFEPGRDKPAESHAWCDAFIPGAGWVEFDPTHPEPDLNHYVRIGVGRDYMDVPPFRGTYLGAPTERMIVTVEVDEVRELAA